jgi:hypothetical protein
MLVLGLYQKTLSSNMTSEVWEINPDVALAVGSTGGARDLALVDYRYKPIAITHYETRNERDPWQFNIRISEG